MIVEFPVQILFSNGNDQIPGVIGFTVKARVKRILEVFGISNVLATPGNPVCRNSIKESLKYVRDEFRVDLVPGLSYDPVIKESVIATFTVNQMVRLYERPKLAEAVRQAFMTYFHNASEQGGVGISQIEPVILDQDGDRPPLTGDQYVAALYFYRHVGVEALADFLVALR